MAFSFGNTQAQPAQTGGGLFGGLNANANTQNQAQAGCSIFGQKPQTQPAQQSTGFFGQNTQTQQQQQPQQQQQSLFGQSAQAQQPQQPSLFGQTQTQQQQQPTGLFGQTAQTQQPQQQQPSLFGQPVQAQQQPNNQQSQFGSSQLWQPQTQNPQPKSVPEQMQVVLEKWSPNSSTCVFKHYFYNKVADNQVPFYKAGPNEDPKAWDEALSKKPGPGYIPVLCTGFEQLGERIKTQNTTLAAFNRVLHEINGSLDAMMIRHDTETSVRILNAKRKHTMLKQRSLALATKVQILRNRGFAMGAAEEALKVKLTALDKSVCDPALSARAEEIWARMVSVRERARLLKEEMERQAGSNGSSMDEQTARRAEKILEDYATQLAHLKKELALINSEFGDWQTEQAPADSETKRR
ncbi:hypothetical protein VE02_06721 [Pseudogymnoascus sp. 03VT05]|nr:hypothetical protein VE02_06721 [Pseudogymnoascus sp. 03VT05]